MASRSQVVREASLRRLRRFWKEGPWAALLREEFALEIPVLPRSDIQAKGYFSQLGQDWVLDQFIFHQMERGTFIDVGAHDGISLSNSWFLENTRAWRGVCIEPNPAAYLDLVRTRRALCLQAAVSSSGEENMKYLLPSESSLSMLGGLQSTYPRSHLRRLMAESKATHSSVSAVDVSITRLDKIASDFDLQEPDLLLVDVEGAELDVLRSADWRSFRPKVVLVESNYRSTGVIHFLRERNYELLARMGWDRIFITREFPLLTSRNGM
jgi:FkbM family methyltransferase